MQGVALLKTVVHYVILYGAEGELGSTLMWVSEGFLSCQQPLSAPCITSIAPVTRKVSLGLKVHPKVKRGDPVWTRYPKYLAELSWQFLHACTSVTLLKSVHCLFLFLSSSSQDSIKWLPKSPKLYSGHNWSSQSSRWTSLKGKEGFHGGNLYKLSSANGKWREGRISPEQEAEELEDPDEDVGGFL